MQMSRKLQKKPKNAFDFSTDPLHDVNIESELSVPNAHQSHTGYFQNPNGSIIPAIPVQKDADYISDEEFSDDEEEMKIISADRDVMKALIDEMTPEQADRYEVYRRAHLPRGPIKKILSQLIGQPAAPSTNIIVAGCGKLFIGEIVELAREIMQERGDTGPILPHHIREAHQRYMKNHSMPLTNLHRKRLFM